MDNVVFDELGNLFGFTNNSGRVMPLNIFNVKDYKEESEGLVPVKYLVDGKCYWTYVHTNGKRATNECFLEASRFQSGKALTIDINYMLKVYDRSFRVLSERQLNRYSNAGKKLISDYDYKSLMTERGR